MANQVRKKKEKRGLSFLTILEMLFSLLMIPCGLGFAESFEVGPEKIQPILLPVMFGLQALALFLRAKTGRYKRQMTEWKMVEYVFAGLFLTAAVLLAFNQLSVTVWLIASMVFLASLIPGRVLAIRRKRRWYWIVWNIFLILLILYFIAGTWAITEEEQSSFVVSVMIIMALKAFFRVMALTFSRFRLDVLKDIVRRTYAAEIMFGLVLLILSFSWVLVYMDVGFTFTDALWYCFAVVTTIGFGDVTAVSPVGRVLSVILGIYGIIVVALITSIIVNFYGEMKKVGPEDEDPEALEAGQEADPGEKPAG